MSHESVKRAHQRALAQLSKIGEAAEIIEKENAELKEKLKIAEAALHTIVHESEDSAYDVLVAEQALKKIRQE